MDKSAQERTWLNKLREKTNLYGKSLEGFNNEFAEMMQRLRSTDERIRTQAEGVRDLVKSAQQQVNRRDYLAAAIDLTEFHKKCRYIAADLGTFIKSIDTKNFKVLLDQFDEEQKKQLFGYNPDEELSPDQGSVNDVQIETQAGLLDVVHNLTTERGKAMRALEKNFSISFLSDLKKNSYAIVEKSNRFLAFLLTTFKKLATALARRKIKQYVDLAKNFINKLSGKGGYHDIFVKFYNDNVVPLKQQHENIVEEQRKAEEVKSKSIEDAAAKRMQEMQNQKDWAQSGQQQKFENVMNVPQNTTQNNVPIDLKNVKPDPNRSKETLDELDRLHQKASFISQIEKSASSNDPKQMVSQILSFSAELEDTDLDTSLKLIAIAEGLIEEYQIG
jgi:hypothetical protein